MKKVFAWILALAMALGCASAFADAVYTKVYVDEDAAWALAAGFGVPEENLTLLEPVLAVVNALGVNVTAAEDGAQVDLDLNGEGALSVGFALDEAEVRVASTLFPNYLLTVKYDTVGQLMEQYMPKLPAGDEGAGAMDANAVAKVFGGYFEKWFAACAAAGQPGEPETGEYEIDGMMFDTLVPVTVDMEAIAKATKALADEILADPAAASMLRGCAMGMSPGGENADPAAFEAEFRAGFDEWMANMPQSATAELYLSSEDGEIFCLEGEAFFPGRDEAGCGYQMMNKGDGIVTMGYWDYRMDMIVGFEGGGDGFRADFTMGDMYYGIDVNVMTGDVTALNADLYVMDSDAPLASAWVLISGGGERTLSLEAGDRTVLAVEDVMADASGAAAQSLLGDVMINGLGGLTGTVKEQVPEVAALMGMGGSAPAGDEKPAEEEKPAVVADPESWKTLGDVRSLDTDDSEGTWDDKQYTYIFSYAGTKWAVTAEFSEALQDALFSVDFMADDREAQIDAILNPCKITSVVDLKTLAIPQEELDQWTGKTGRELLDAGWEYNGYTYARDGMAINMVNGRIEYLVTFEGGIEAPADFDHEPEYEDKVIEGIQFRGNSYHFFDE